MPILNNNWKTDNYKFVGKAFESQYKNDMNELTQIVGTVHSKSVDYELTGAGGFGELLPYDGSNLDMGNMKRGFKTIIVPAEYDRSTQIGMKAAKVDRSGECARAGKRLSYSATKTVYMHMLRMFGNAFDAAYKGGDDNPFAANDHPVASLGSQGRKYIPDPESGTYSNLIAKALAVSAISEMETMARRMVGPDGLPVICNLDTLLVSPELEGDAIKICGLNSRVDLMPKRDPSGDTNAANPVYGKKYIVIGGGADGFAAKQWAMCDSTIMKEVCKLVYITEPSLYESKLDNPLIQQFTAYCDFGLGWGDARQIIFSRGA